MQMHDYIISTRRIKGGDFEAEPGAVRFLKVPKDADIYTPAHEEKRVHHWVDEVRGLADGDDNPLSISPYGDVLIFVHGYNNNPEIILKRIRQLDSDLRAEGWRGVVVGFDWPSEDNTLNYLEDRSDASQVARLLVEKGIRLIAAGQKGGCRTNVHLLGHSTGAYVIMEAFDQAERDGNLFKGDWRFGQVAFIGGDVSVASLTRNPAMFDRIMRLTNYSSRMDAVLAVSNAKRLGVAPRVGRVGLEEPSHPKAVNVDCTIHFRTLDPDKAPKLGTWVHSWHIGDRVFARDLAMTLEGAIDRHALPTRREESGRLYLQDAPRPKGMEKWGIFEASENRD